MNACKDLEEECEDKSTNAKRRSDYYKPPEKYRRIKG